ncbi:MAG: class I adenylate-forming enzyme family protein [Kineosporiaceae bacterium]
MTSSGENTADYLLAQAAPRDVALVEGSARHTYADLRRAAGRIAAELELLRLAPGSRVAILGPNSLLWVAGYLAIMKLGHVAVPLSDKLTPDAVRRNADLVGCVAVVGDRRVLRRFPDVFAQPVAVVTDAVLIDDGPVHWPEPEPADLDTDAVLMFTSGSTAQPKAVRVTHRNIQANTASIVEYLGLGGDDRILVILPFYYCYGASLLHTHLRVGGRMVLCNSFVFPETALDQLEREGCTVLAGVPSSFQLLLRAATFASRELGSLRIIQQAGGKLPQVLVEELTAAQPQARLFVMYGQTEATARLSYLPPERLWEKQGSIGRGIPGVTLSVLGEDWQPVAPGQRGEIYARGASIAAGYYGDPAGTAEKFTEHGLRTGDIAVVDDEGFIYLVDRRDDFIKSWGYRVSSQEIEACVLRMERLVSAAAVGVPDDEAGEAICLFVVGRPGEQVSEADVLAFCRSHLSANMVPRSVIVLSAMPLTANGKVAKPRLRELATASTPDGAPV